MFKQAINTFDVNNNQHSIPSMKTYFASVLIEKDIYPLAFELLKDVGDVYCKHIILDYTFLMMRGIPSFIEYLEILSKLIGKVEDEDCEELINKLERELGEEGKFFIDDIIKKV